MSAVRRGGLLLAVVAALIGCRPDGARRPRRLTLYCSAQHEWCELVARRFEADSGIRVSMIRKSTGEVYAQLWAERRNPKGDVWWGGTGDTHFQAARANLTRPYRSPRVPELHAWARDPMRDGQDRTTGIYMGALGIAYNREWLARKGIAPPKGWQDLLRPELKGEIQMANPNSSGTAYTALATFVQLYGEEEGFRLLLALDANINQYTQSGAAPVRNAARGEAGVAVVFLHDAATQAAAGFPIELVAPEEGTGYEVGCVSMVRGARHADEARAFIDWALSPEAQGLAAEAKAFQIPSHPQATLPPEAPRMDRVPLIDFDFGRFSEKAVRSHLLRRWDEEVKGRGAR